MPVHAFNPFAVYNDLHSTSYYSSGGACVYVPFDGSFWFQGHETPGPFLQCDVHDRENSEPTFVDALTGYSGLITHAYYDAANEIVVGYGLNLSSDPAGGCLFGYDLSGNLLFQVDIGLYSDDYCRAFTSNPAAGTTLYCIRSVGSTYYIASINVSTGARTNIHEITGASDGCLILDNDGNLWFARSDGGSNGSVILYDVAGDAESTIYDGSTERAEPVMLYDPVAHTIGWFAETGGTYGWEWYIYDIAGATTSAPIDPSEEAFSLMTSLTTTGYKSDIGAFVGESYGAGLTPNWGLVVINPTTFDVIERIPDTNNNGSSSFYVFTHKRYDRFVEHWIVNVGEAFAEISIWSPVQVVKDTSTVCNFDTITSLVTADTLAGMEVTAVFDSGAFTETVTWEATSGTAGACYGTGWSIACDGNTGPNYDSPWTFTFDGVATPLTQLVFNVEPAGCVLDVEPSIYGSHPGSAGGGPFTPLTGLDGCWITASYSKLTLSSPYTIADGYLDLFLIATIDFGGTPPSTDFTFFQDHDTVTGLVCPVVATGRFVIVNINMRRR